jgi:hypothetical protein
MRTPGIKIEELMRVVQDSVESLAQTVRHEQRPAVYNESRGNFYFYQPTAAQIQTGITESEERAWVASETANSMNAYQIYLDAYPKGKYAVTAKIRAESLRQGLPSASSDPEAALWSEVKANGTRGYLEAYVGQYPEGRYLALARAELKRLDAEDNARLGRQALDTQQAIRDEQAAWDEAQKANTVNGLAAYLEKYPVGRFAVQAKLAKQAAERRVTDAVRAEEAKAQVELAKKVELDRFMSEAKKAAEKKTGTGASAANDW